MTEDYEEGVDSLVLLFILPDLENVQPHNSSRFAFVDARLSNMWVKISPIHYTKRLLRLTTVSWRCSLVGEGFFIVVVENTLFGESVGVNL